MTQSTSAFVRGAAGTARLALRPDGAGVAACPVQLSTLPNRHVQWTAKWTQHNEANSLRIHVIMSTLSTTYRSRGSIWDPEALHPSNDAIFFCVTGHWSIS